MPSSEEDRFEELDKMKGDQKDIFKSVLDRADSLSRHSINTPRIAIP